MKLKMSVAIALGVSFTLMTVVLIIGLFVPKSTLVSLSKDKQAAKDALQTQTVANDTSSPTSQSNTDQTAPTTNQQSNAPTNTQNTTTNAVPSAATPTSPTTSGGGSSGATTPTAVAPTLTFSGAPTTITSGASAVLSWSINNSATAPVSCTGGGGTFSGSKATSGSQTVSPTSTTSYTLACSNAAGNSGTKTVTITVNAPVASCGQAGGSCTSAQVATHNTSANCWVIYAGSYYVLSGSNLPSGKSAYPSQHNGGSGAFTSSTCGKDITAYMNGSTNAGTTVGRHNHSTSAYNTLNSYKVGPVN